MQLVHYSEYPIRHLFNIRQKNREIMNSKPAGLWVSPDSEEGWKQWCLDQNFAIERLKYRYEIDLVENPNILFIGEIKELDEFCKIYKVEKCHFQEECWKREKSLFKKLGIHREDPVYSIDWELVGDEYDGIIISPWQNSTLLSQHRWYYGWDCAGGCIWGTDAISEVRVILPEATPPEVQALQINTIESIRIN